MGTESTYLESYPNSAWAGDNVLCLASLSLHDKIYPTSRLNRDFVPQHYKATIDVFWDRIKTHLDPKTGLTPHAFYPKMNVGFGGVRGSSQSLVNCFLPDIDAAFAKDQFEKYKALFADYRLGLPAIREYPKGVDEAGDVDSGPVIWDIGTVSTIVAIRAMAENKECALYAPIRNGIEGFGLPNAFSKGKKYIFGSLTVADAFIVWGHSKDARHISEPPFSWRLIFHLWSLLLIAPICWLAYKI